MELPEFLCADLEVFHDVCYKACNKHTRELGDEQWPLLWEGGEVFWNSVEKDASSRIHHNSTLATRKQTGGQQRTANVESAEASAGGGA